MGRCGEIRLIGAANSRALHFGGDIPWEERLPQGFLAGLAVEGWGVVC
jgi:hypothetical protein